MGQAARITVTDRVIFGFTWLEAFNPYIDWTSRTWDDTPIEVTTRALSRARFLGVEDYARKRLRKADAKRENTRKTLASKALASQPIDPEAWKEYFPEHPDGFPRNTRNLQEPTEVSMAEKSTTLWRHQTIDSIRASIKHDKQQAKWQRNKAAEIRTSMQELPELDMSNHPELVEFRKVFPQYPSGITAISSPRNSLLPATSEVKTLDLAHRIEVNKTSMAT
jgi:hypothetical protein